MMPEDVDVALLARNILAHVARMNRPIHVYWMQIFGDRDEYASGLQEALGPGCAVLVVRRPIFLDPNSVMADLAQLLEEFESDCKAAIEDEAHRDSLTVVLLGRSSLAVPQLSSPVVLPEWLPNVGGTVVSVSIEDMTKRVVAPLDAPQVAATEIAEGLYRLEGLMINRMKDVWKSDKQIADAFSGQFGRSGDPALSALLEAMIEHRRSVTYSGAYRPSRRTAESLTSRLWSIGQDRNSEESGPGRALARCLGLREVECSVTPSIFYVLRRPVNAPTAWEAAARDLIVTITTACQFLTAAAHADVYPEFSVALIDSASREIRNSIRAWEQLFARLD